VSNPFAFNLRVNVQQVLPTVTLSTTDALASETPTNTGRFTLSRTGSTAVGLPVSLSISGTATNGSDYNALSTTQTIPSGQSSLTITLTPIDDTVIEDVETATLTVVGGSGYQVGSPSSGTVTITDNDFTPCTANNTTLCFAGGRFEVTLTATVNGSPVTGRAVPLSSQSGAFWLFNPDNLEVGVKVLEATGAGKFWVFHGAATNQPYTVTFRDRANPSRVRIFTKPLNSFCGGTDQTFFDRLQSEPPAEVELLAPEPFLTNVEAFTCTPNSTTVCLLGNRFQVRVLRSGTPQPAVTVSNQTGIFTFFNPSNLELFVKMLDGTSVNGRFWVFYGSLTNQAFTIEVTDSVTRAVKAYPSGAGLCGAGDTSAF
jgi:hypothetical protein